MTGEPLRQLHRSSDRAYEACRHRRRSMAGEGLSGFDPELITDAGSDVVPERLWVQSRVSSCSRVLALENASTITTTEALLKMKPTTERNCEKTHGFDFTCGSGIPTPQSHRSR